VDLKPTQSDMSQAMVAAIEQQYEANPPTIAVIGLSGVGKSSTINAMFGTQLLTSATTRGTSEFESIRAKLGINRGQAKGGVGFLRVYDAPGLGEDQILDPKYLRMYEQHLPKCDVALWLVAARNRALALDQMYLDRLGPLLAGKIVFGISQVDLVDPILWDRARNMPSEEQAKNIALIAKDRADKLGNALGAKVECLPFSAPNYFRLMELYEHIITGVSPDRRWMFELVRTFSTADWIKGAEGLSETRRAEMIAEFGVEEGKYAPKLDGSANESGDDKRNGPGLVDRLLRFLNK